MGQKIHCALKAELKPGSMTRDLTETEVDRLNLEMEDTLASFHFKDLPSWLNKNIHETKTEIRENSGENDAC